MSTGNETKPEKSVIEAKTIRSEKTKHTKPKSYFTHIKYFDGLK